MTFESIVTDYQATVFRVCFSIVKDYFEAENLTQETFLTLYRAYPYESLESPKALLAKIATNKSLDYLKSSYKKHAVLTEPQDMPDPPEADSTESAALSHEFLRRAEKLCEQLKSPYREIAELYYIQNKTIDELNALFPIPKKSLQTKLYRARNQLRKLWKEQMDE